jgi:diguanylate cyclase (GGDEF)-like protein/PAS domain S-box-containing protein
MHNLLKGLVEKPTQHSRLALVFFLVLVLSSPVIGYWTYVRQKDAQELQVKESLARIAHIRANAISSNLAERAGDATIAVGSPFFRNAVASWEKTQQNDSTRKQIRARLAALQQVYGYTDAAIVDMQGHVLIAAENVNMAVDQVTVELIRRAAASHAVQMSSIRALSVDGISGRAIDIVAPFFSEQARSPNPETVLLLRFDPRREIYPELQWTPISNLQNDTLIVEIRGQQVVALSDANFCSCRYLDVIPITPQQLRDSAKASTATLAWKSETGSTEFGAAHAIDGVPWFIINTASEHAINAIIRDTVRIAVTTSIVTLCVLGIGIFLWWRYRESEYKLAALQTETRERLLQQKYDYLSKYANDIIILTDAESKVLEVNDKAVQVLGYPAASLAGQSITILSPHASLEQLKANLSNLLCDGTALFETSLQRRDGSVFPTEVSARSIHLEGQSFSQFICRDITERKEAERKIQMLAYYDSVTSLPNRALLNDRLDQALHMAMRSCKKVGVLFLDLDNFKNVNDSLGHQVGDMLLRAVGKRLQDCVREEDTVARIGGDEFMILLPDLERGEEARHVAEKAISALTTPFPLQNHQVYTTTSIGISLFPDDSSKVPDLIKYADSALYEAKNRGRNNYQFFTQSLNEQITLGSRIERRLRDAMETGELCLWYQPQIDVRSGKVIGAEALLRWRDGNPEYFRPTDCIAVAEERGLIVKLGEWTLREACRQCSQWQAKGLQMIPVAVNVSPIQLQQKEFAELVLEILRDSDLEASFLELEITETSVMRSAQVVAELAMRLRDSGVRISIDDFGTGYSSLSFLKHIPIDKIKIDRSFVLDMLNDAEDDTITQAIVKLGQSLQLRVIAEGVESQAQVERLLSLGCHEVQGFYYSRAVSSEQFQAFLEKGWHFDVAEEIEPA